MCSDEIVLWPIKESVCHGNFEVKVFNLNKKPSCLSWKPRLRESHTDVTPLSRCLESGKSMIFIEFISILC